MSFRPRRLGHEGRVLAHGFVLDPAHLGEVEARRRVFALLDPGAVVRRDRGRYVVLLSTGVWCHARRATGAPLVVMQGRLTGCPLEEDELELVPAQGALVLPEGGVARVLDVDALEPAAPDTWLDLRAYTPEAVTGLGAPPPPPEPPPPPPSPVLRDHLPDLPEAEPEVQLMKAALRGEDPEWPEPDRPSLWARLFGRRRGREAKARAAPEGAQKRSTGPASRAPGLWTRLLGWLGALGRSSATSEDATGEASTRPATAAGPGRLRAWLADLWTQFAFRSRLARVLGKRQARYLQDLFDKLEDGDLDDALRHAIPLGGDGDGPKRPSLGAPKPRDRLAVNLGPRQGGAGGALVVHDEVFDLLRAHYRRAFDRLVRAGRIEEAAFVLADLLDEASEAVSFLEQHERFTLAAELAEARGFPPARVIRQWVLADDVDRAVRIAKRFEAFPEAIALLGKEAPETADRLRMLWGDALAERGDFAEAVDAVWSLAEARSLANRWIAIALEAGGPGAARCLVRAVERMPERFEAWAPRAEAMWTSSAPEAPWTRMALAEALNAAPWSAAIARLAVGSARALARDASDGAHADPRVLDKLVEVSRDPLLRADWPGAKPRKRAFVDGDEALALDVPATDAGNLPIFDAVPVGGGRMLLALGEAGARLVTRDGRVLRHFDPPAHALVISFRGHRALTLAKRGRLTKVGRIDLVHRRASPWCELALDAHASTFDGWTWHVAHDGVLCTLDPMEARPVELWRNKDCHPAEITASEREILVVHEAEDQLEMWRFDLRRRVLAGRTAIRFPDRVGRVRIGRPNPLGDVPYVGQALHLDPEALDDEVTVQSRATVGIGSNRMSAFPLDLPPAAQVLAVTPIGRSWVGVVTKTLDGVQIQLVRALDGRQQVRLRLAGATFARLRFDPPLLTVFDDRGRVLGLDLAAGRLVRSMRLRG